MTDKTVEEALNTENQYGQRQSTLVQQIDVAFAEGSLVARKEFQCWALCPPRTVVRL